jgi:hypothetical protein
VPPTGPAPVEAVPSSTAPSPPAAPVAGQDGLLLGIELGLAHGVGKADGFRLFQLGAQVGWASPGRAALFATASAGILGAAEGALFASVGVGARLWFGRAFADARIERMSVVLVDCEETCDGVGINRYSGGIGIDAVRGPNGGMQLSLELTRMAGLSAFMLSIGGYVQP